MEYVLGFWILLSQCYAQMKSSFPGLIFVNRAPNMYYIRTTCLQQKIFLTDAINRGQLLELGSWDLRQRMEICSKIL